VQGVIDLLLSDGDGYEILDYKTGSIDAQKLAEYTRQLQIYASAAQKILKKKITRLRLYSFATGSFTEIPVPQDV
jgi:ATP-dependent helicase/nuclease subunit A